MIAAGAVTLIAVEDINLAGSLNTNLIDGVITLTSMVGRIYMIGEDSITSKALFVSSKTGIFLRTDVVELTAKTTGIDLAHHYRLQVTTLAVRRLRSMKSMRLFFRM